ncbi:MAG: hypothetical protein JXR76_04980 [Deltaproteobacteria bacterium]|nr:hypothetical protein [Deltaproteobacteria bacterium]
MKKTLDDLCTMEGINGVFVCTIEGELVAFSAPRVYDAETLAIAATTAAQAAESISVQHANWDSLVANFRDGKLIFIQMDQYLLCVISDLNTNVPFLNVAIKVAKNKIKRKLDNMESGMSSTASLSDAKFSSQFSSPPAAFPQGMHSSGMQATSPATRSTMGEPLADVGSGFSWSGVGAASTGQSSAVSVIDEAASKMLTRVSEALAEIVGPMAKVFVKEAVQKICPTEPFSMNHLMRLLRELESEHISDKLELKLFRDKLHR